MLGFWKTDRGSLFSHKTGLTKEQVEFFKKLKEGDRIVLFNNKTKFGAHSPDYTLRKWLSEEEYEQSNVSEG